MNLGNTYEIPRILCKSGPSLQMVVVEVVILVVVVTVIIMIMWSNS